MNIIANTPKLEKCVGGSLVLGGAASATVSLLAAKSVIAIGLASNVIPIIGTIMGIAMMILGAFIFLRAWKNDQVKPSFTQKVVIPIPLPAPTRGKKDRQVQQKEFLTLPPVKQKMLHTLAVELEKMQAEAPPKVIEAAPAPAPAAAANEDPLHLTNADKMQAGTNLVQWGLIGASFLGVPASIVLPLSMVTGLGTEIAAFCALPKDASWLRYAMSIPVLSKMLINYNPWIGKLYQGVSFVNSACSTVGKLWGVWTGWNQDPGKAKEAAAVHMFNLASSTAFAADSAGLISLKPAEKAPDKVPCDPASEKNCEGPINRKIRLATVYNNKGANAANRQKISDITTANHKKYADKWNAEHDVVTHSLVDGQCKNPLTGRTDNCSPYWNKIKYFKDWCETPRKPGTEEWAIYADDDAVYTNFQVDPSHAIDQLRGDVDSSFIIATEGKGTRFNPGAVNTGVMIVRKDPGGCEAIERIWENRNTLTSEDPTCPTFGLCKNQKNGDEQGATDRVLWSDAPHLLKGTVTRLMARDATHPKRGHLALNTVYRAGCFTTPLPDGSQTGAYDINIHDQRTNPEGVWKEGDWIGQTAGYPLYGQDLSHMPKDSEGNCVADPKAPVEPIRIKKVEEMLRAAEKTLTVDPRPHTSFAPYYVKTDPSIPEPCMDINRPRTIQSDLPKEITFGAVYDNSSDPNRNAISDFVNANHGRYAKKWGLKHEVVAKNLVAGKCLTSKNEAADCAPYWNKMQMLREWLAEPAKPGVEEWRVYADDDMLVTNMDIDPAKAIDQLRDGKDTSFIVAEDVIDWQRWFFETSDPHKAVNTGLFIVRKDAQSRQFVEEVWAQRHRPVNSPVKDCENIGTCKFQDRSMQEQEAMTIVLRNRPSYIDSVVSVLAPRDKESANRKHLALNTFYRNGCFRKKGETHPFTYEGMDRSENPDGAFQKGDWLTQAAGVPVWGKDLPFTQGACIDKADVQEGPVRLNKLKDLAQQITETASGA